MAASFITDSQEGLREKAAGVIRNESAQRQTQFSESNPLIFLPDVSFKWPNATTDSQGQSQLPPCPPTHHLHTHSDLRPSGRLQSSESLSKIIEPCISMRGQIDWREQSGGRLRSLPSGPERENMVEGTESHGRRSPLSINRMIGRAYAEPHPHLMEQSQRMGV